MRHASISELRNARTDLSAFTASPLRTDAPLEQFPELTTTMSSISITINPIALITTECVTVASAMRKTSKWAQSSAAAILGGGAGKLAGKDVSRPSSRASGQTRTPSIALSGANILHSEGEESLASRWGLRGKKGRSMQDNPLLSAFARLRTDLAGCKDIHTFDAPSLLHPFLQVIRSSSTSAGITSLAVISITKFFAYNLVTTSSPRISIAMQLLSAAITHCRFEATESSADEIVLLRILKLMENVISRPEGQLLGDESVCEMMETGLSMCCQARLSEVLRRSAEIAMVEMCQVIFGRLKVLKPEPPPQRSRSNTLASLQLKQEVEEVKMEPSVDGTTLVSPNSSNDLGVDTVDAERTRTSIETRTPSHRASLVVLREVDDTDLEEVKPYSLPSIKELFRVLIDLLDPHNKQHTDTMRVMALRIIDVALEVAGPAIAKHFSLAQLAKDDLCRHLFQLVKSENTALLYSSLRVAGTLLTTCRSILKLQQELFLSYLVTCLHPKVGVPQEPGIDPTLYDGVPHAPKLTKPMPSGTVSGRATPVPVKERQKLGLEGGARKPDAREAMVESIGTLVRIPSFMMELFVNYDCDVDRADLCEDLVGLLSRNAFPDSAQWSTTNVPPLCLDSLLAFIQSISDRLDEATKLEQPEKVMELRKQRSRKKIIVKGVSIFNEEPRKGVAYLVQHGIISNHDDPIQVAKFLKGTTRVSKQVLGEFITKKSNGEVLTAFIDQFDFDYKRIDEALRELLGSFRLPGESALIERIVTVFTEKYCAANVPEGIADKDSAFVLTYAIIMLNTNLYNPNVKALDKMTYEQFAKNLRGVNNGKDFDPEYLKEIYDAIKSDEIILPDEHDNKHAFEYAWKELLMKTDATGDLELCDTNTFDAEMFQATWKPIVATLSYVFMSASDDSVYSRVVIGFDQCARIAAKYRLVDAFDKIIYILCQISTLATESPPTTSLNTEVQAGSNSVMVSELAVKFGRDFRAQLATVVLFRVLADHENVIGDSWPFIIRIFSNLFTNSLIPAIRPADTGLGDLASIPLQPPSQIIDRDERNNEAGLFSSFTNYLSSYTADEPPEPSEEELENTLSAVDCVKSCHCDVILENILDLPATQVSKIVTGLLSQLPENSSPIVSVKPDRQAPVAGRMNGVKAPYTGQKYNAGTIYLLEFATALTIRDVETVQTCGEQLTGTLQQLARDAANLHPTAASRSVYYLLALLRRSYDQDFMRTAVVLHAISSFEDVTMGHTASAAIAGLTQCIAEPSPLRKEIINSPDFWSIMHRLHQHKEEAEKVFLILSTIVAAEPSAVTADNYESVIDTANDFATAGSVGAIQEQRREVAVRKGQKVKQAKPQ